MSEGNKITETHSRLDINGVRLRKEKLSTGEESFYWATTWRENGKEKKMRFALSSYRDFEGKPPCWWAFIEAYGKKIEEDGKNGGRTDYPDDGISIRRIYNKLTNGFDLQK